MKYTQRGSGSYPVVLLRQSRQVQGNPKRHPGIEGVEMTKAYYIRTQTASVVPLLVLLVSAFTLGSPARTKAPQAALKTASLESHEGLTISALPWTEPEQYKEKFPKKSPYSAGVLAVQVVFRNDSNDSLRVNLDRIRLTLQIAEENRQEVQPLTSEQLADAVFKPAAKDPTQRRRLPIPVGGGGGKSTRDKHWMELKKQAQDAEIPSSVIAARSTLQGLLYFDLQNQFDLLQSAHLYIPQISQMEGSRALTYFDIDLSRRGPQ
jgi:hypothetical protein